MKPPYQKVFCIGLGGIGVSAIAKYYAARGCQVIGSDAAASPVIDDAVRHGVTFIGADTAQAHISPDIDLVIYTDACRPDHPELLAARTQGLKTQTFGQALGEIMAAYPTRVAISGTNGKSTTTALTSLLLVDAGLDPTVFVGSRVTSFDGNLRLGGADLFVAEADEWRNHFHALHPTILTITNIEHDHPDFFADQAAVVASFQTMIERVPADGKIVLNIDDPATRRWIDDPRAITVSAQHPADLFYTIDRSGPEYQTWSATWQGRSLGSFPLHIPGAYNVANAACALATALTVGGGTASLDQTFSAFRGIWRRFEVIRPGSPTVINDYAHHPTGINGTIQAAREFYPGRRIVAAFQPHHHSRLTALYPDFVSSFNQADVIIIDEVYAVLGRENTVGMKTGQDLVRDLQALGKDAQYAADTAATLTILQKIIQPDDVVLVMGAGDIWTIGELVANTYA